MSAELRILWESRGETILLFFFPASIFLLHSLIYGPILHFQSAKLLTFPIIIFPLSDHDPPAYRIIQYSCDCIRPTCLEFSHSVLSNSLQLHGLQHARLPCPSPTPRACSNSCPSNRGWLVMPSNHLILSHQLLLPSIFPSIRVFSSESVLCIRWPKYRSFSFSINPSN